MKLTFLVAIVLGVSVASAQVKKSTVEGVTNFAQVETTVACAGAVTPSSLANIKKMGFASVINLRLATEQEQISTRKRRPPKLPGSLSCTSPSTEVCPTPPSPTSSSRSSRNRGMRPRLSIAPAATERPHCG